MEFIQQNKVNCPKTRYCQMSDCWWLAEYLTHISMQGTNNRGKSRRTTLNISVTQHILSQDMQLMAHSHLIGLTTTKVTIPGIDGITLKASITISKLIATFASGTQSDWRLALTKLIIQPIHTRIVDIV